MKHAGMEPQNVVSDARTRIVASARRSVLQSGEGRASSGRIAMEIGVSKALVHYHFADKRALLLALVTESLEGIEARRTKTVAEHGAGDPIQDCRAWVADELEARDVELLVQLARSEDDEVARSAREAIQLFRETLAGRVAGTLRALETDLAVRDDLVLDLIATTVFGLINRGIESDRAESEAILDTLWLAVLSLAR